MARPETPETPPPEATERVAEASGTTKVLDSAASQLTALQRALSIQEGDPVWVGGLKILGMILVGALLLALSPLIIFGLVVGLAAAA